MMHFKKKWNGRKNNLRSIAKKNKNVYLYFMSIMNR